MVSTLRAGLAATVFACASALAPFAHAQSSAWPQRPVKFVVPLGPGAGADIGARLFAERLSGRWGQPVLVENRPGGDGVVGLNAVIGAKDDHVLFFGPSSSYVGHPYSFEKMPYDATELQPVARVSTTIVALAVPASMQITTLRDFFDHVRRNPGKMNWTSVTTISDVLFEGYFRKAGYDMSRIGYKDTVSAINDLVEARIHLYGAAYAIVRGQAQGGRIRIVAITNANRAPMLDLPTVAELGVPEMTFDGLVGLVTMRSSNLDAAARRRIVEDVRAVAGEPLVIERMNATAQLLVPGDSAEFIASIDAQAKSLATIAKTLGMKSAR